MRYFLFLHAGSLAFFPHCGVIGKRIKELREKAGWTQERAAEAAGITGKHWGDVERGSVAVSAMIWNRMAQGLGVPMASLLETRHHHTRDEILQELHDRLERADDKLLRLYLRILLAITR